jgi:hypothetical protein
VLLSINDILFDNGSTIHLIKNPKLLTEIQDTESPIIVNGVQSDAEGVRVNQQRKFGDIGTVYYSENSSAKILSTSGLVDSGATVKYDQKHNRFTVQPKGSSKIICFCRKKIAGKFYMCNIETMVAKFPSNHPKQEETLVTAVAENLVKYTKREVLGARKARSHCSS